MEKELNAPHSMGTTIIGVTYNGGVVLGADSRTSTGIVITITDSEFDFFLQLIDILFLFFYIKFVFV